MLRDPRAKSLVENFASQWLQLRDLQERRAGSGSVSRSSTRTCARRSGARPSCSSAASCSDDRAIPELLTADYTFLNERLARHYGVPGVSGSRFRRVADRRAPSAAACSAMAAC